MLSNDMSRGKWQFTKIDFQEFPTVHWLGLSAFTARGPGSFLIVELRSRKSRGAAQNKEIKLISIIIWEEVF